MAVYAWLTVSWSRGQRYLAYLDQVHEEKKALSACANWRIPALGVIVAQGRRERFSELPCAVHGASREKGRHGAGRRSGSSAAAGMKRVSKAGRLLNTSILLRILRTKYLRVSHDSKIYPERPFAPKNYNKNKNYATANLSIEIIKNN